MHRELDLFQILDGTAGLFEFLNVFPKGVHESFRVLRGQDDPGFDATFRGAGHDVHEIQDEFGMAMGDDGQVRILAFRYFL